MSKYFGDIKEDSTIKLPWNTFNSAGASVTVTAISTNIEVFKDGVILTDPDAGGTVTLNVGTGDGSHFVTIDTSADAEYTTGSDYEAKLAGITIDSQTVNAFVGSFSIENRSYIVTDIVSSGPITTSTGAVVNVDNVISNVQGNVQGNVTGSVGSVIADVSLGTDAVDANVLAADAVAEIQSGLALNATVAKEATLGTPANIDSGGATIADNLKKIADDNGGADYDATTDSLEKISGSISSGGGTPLLT